MKNLVIVESPKKAQLIQGFLKKNNLTGYKVMASVGHIRDLKKKSFSIDLEHNYAPEYEVSADKKQLIKELKAEVKKSDMVYLASDEDREGEAIAWHLKEVLGLKNEQCKRIVFHEITSEAFMEALQNPRDINQNLVDAQQARRVLDRIVGFELSPVLWRRIGRSAPSAGRVQSVAVRLIVEREREIQRFVAKSSFRVQAVLQLPTGQELKAELNHRFETEEEVENFLKLCASNQFSISDISKKSGRRSPAAPFTTSTLQQEASSRLGYSVGQTMRVAQSLYESGHITYMRTDSVNLSAMAMNTIAKQVKAVYGEEYYKARKFHTKSKGAQEAHEAIRPSYADRATIEGTAQEKRLYELIRRRTLASQMADAKIERTTVEIPVKGSKYLFIAQGEVVVFKGFLELYMDGSSSDNKLLPAMQVGERLERLELTADERFTQRPARYTEGSMVSKMEDLNIGRPSTYAPTIQTIQARGYVERGDKEGEEREVRFFALEGSDIKRSVKKETFGADKAKLMPTDTGIVVNDFLVEQFPNIIDFDFTANVEEEFDYIAEGDRKWQGVIDTFYKDFHPEVELAQKPDANRKGRVGSRELGTDPKTGRVVMACLGRYGSMIQIGTADEVEKPKFASLQAHQSLETITLEEALKLFDLPKELGEYEGEKVSVAIGRFGPYVKVGKAFVSIPKDKDPLDTSLEDAIELIKAKREAEAKSLIRSFGEGFEIRDGRYGPYIKFEGSNYKIPKGQLAEELTEEDCRKIIEETPPSGSRKRRASTTKKTTAKKTTTRKKATTAKKKTAKA